MRSLFERIVHKYKKWCLECSLHISLLFTKQVIAVHVVLSYVIIVRRHTSKPDAAVTIAVWTHACYTSSTMTYKPTEIVYDVYIALVS
jgi:hypothetical protein